jgi:hypothetical protein
VCWDKLYIATRGILHHEVNKSNRKCCTNKEKPVENNSNTKGEKKKKNKKKIEIKKLQGYQKD